MSTTYMGLTLPTVSVTGGPTYATQLNTALTSIDSHNHVSGSGQQVPSAGLNINADLPFNLTGTAFNATGLRSTRFISQASPIALTTDINTLSVSGGNLYYNNGSGQSVQITSGAALSASSLGGISGLAAPASAAYGSGTGTFTWTSNTNVAATMDNGPITIRDTAVSAPGITLKNPVGIGGAYSITLPAAVPGATSFLTMSSAGVLTAGTALTGALTTTNLSASAGIVGTQLAANTVARAQLASVGQQISASGSANVSSTTYTNVTNMTVTLTTTGRPVIVMAIPDGSANDAVLNGGAGIGSWGAAIARGGSQIARWSGSGPGRFVAFPVTIDAVGAGTYTYTFQIKGDGVNQAVVQFMMLAAYEL